MLAVFAGYLGVHFSLYVLALRHTASFRRESIIFRYHAVSALACATAVTLVLACNPTAERVAEAVIVVAGHGIYSLSFLELWSLAEGGYSLRILMDWETSGQVLDRSELQRIGEAKKKDRLVGLQRLGLLQEDKGRLSLSRRGRVVATVLAGIVLIIGQKQPPSEKPLKADAIS